MLQLFVLKRSSMILLHWRSDGPENLIASPRKKNRCGIDYSFVTARKCEKKKKIKLTESEWVRVCETRKVWEILTLTIFCFDVHSCETIMNGYHNCIMLVWRFCGRHLRNLHLDCHPTNSLILFFAVLSLAFSLV